MAEIHETVAATPNMDPPEIGQDQAPTPSEMPVNKGKGRQRLLRGLQRISSSPSLTNIRRPRSSSAPYKPNTRGTLSCISLAADEPRQPTQIPGYSTPVPSPLGPSSTAFTRPDTPAGEFPFYDSLEIQLPTRKVENAFPSSNQATVALPAELKTPRTDLNKARCRASSAPMHMKPAFRFWDHMPHEMRVHILSFLRPKELVQASRTSKSFYKFCFDGQLWTCIDASEFYRDIPAESLARIIMVAGPFIKDLNLRGCVQVEHYKRTEVLAKACRNLINATLEGCRNFQKNTLHTLLANNNGLVHLNLTGLTAVSNKSCKIVSESCPQLESINISWCGKVDHKGIKFLFDGCTQLRDLRAGEVRGFDNIGLAKAMFKTNNLERLVLSGCAELDDDFLKTMIHGIDPEIDILTNLPVVPPRKLRHLDLSRCSRLTDTGVRSLGYNTPNLEGLQLSRCKSLTNAALEPILASAHRLTHLELEDLNALTNPLLTEHLVKAPCATTLEHLSLSYCEQIGDVGVLPLMQKCVALKRIDLDNTRISDLVLAEAATMVNNRSKRATNAGARTEVTLNMVVYDCPRVTWTGIREVLFRNAQIRPGLGETPAAVTYPTESIALKCFYSYQMTVDEHQKRVLKGDLHSAGRLERRWADFMQATEEAGLAGSGYRRRRRRAREAQALHLNEEDGQGGRRRARTLGSCFVM